MQHASVRNVILKQSLFQRLFNMGSIGISSSGQAGVEIYVEGISNPMAVKRLIESHGEGAPIQAGPSIDKLAVAVFAVTAIIAAIMWWTLISRISAILLKGQ